MNRMLLMACAIFCSVMAHAQLLSWAPDFPVENNPAQTLVITVDATKGNQGLLNYTPTNDVYVHIGVITNQSSNSADWKHVLFTWATTPAAANATYLGSNKWQFTITGSLRTYFNLTDPNETIQKIAILFRNGPGTKKQANSDQSDMYIPIYTSNLAVRINTPPFQPKYLLTPEPQNWIVGSNFSVQASANKPSAMKLYHNGTVIATATNVQSISGNSTVSATGNQQIIAEANDGTTTKHDTVNIFVAPTSSPTAALPAGVRDGINYEAGDTSVILVLRAPGKTIATVIGDFNNWVQNTNYIMNKTPDGKFFWLRVKGLTPGTEYAYQYQVDDTIKIADPYTEKILDPYNDAGISPATYPNLKPYPSGQTGRVSIIQTASPSYNWAVNNFSRPDKRGLVIYELLVRDFVAAHDWKTLRDTLNYIKNTGFNAIEIMPFNEFENNISWGYDPNFYFAPDKYYGPKNTLKEFIDSCHSKGIAVIMDIALNHSFGSSPMVQLYWDAANSRPAANNPWFNPVPKHAYNVGYDMNHESADTKYYFGRIVEHWLQQYKLDGFRFDLSKGFTQIQTCDAAGNNCNVNAWGNYDASRIAIWKGYYDTVQNKSNGAYVILEHFAVDQEEQELSNYSTGMMLWNNLAYNYEEGSMGYVSTSNIDRAIPATHGFTKPYLVTYAESHDEERVVYKNINFGNSAGSYNIKDTATALKRMELTAAFLLTIPGPKMVWQFGELGYDYSINTCSNGTIDPNNCRLSPKPIRWDYLNDARRRNVRDVYARLNKLRFHRWYKDAFTSGAIDRSLAGAFKWIIVNADTSRLVVVGNFDVTATNGTVTFPLAGTWYDYLNNTTFTATGVAQTITLQPGEYHVYTNRNVNSATTTALNPVAIANNLLDVQVYPNPAQGQFVLDINVPQTGTATVALLNVLGQKALLYNGLLTKGIHHLPFDRKAISSANGTYYLQISTKSASKTIQLLLQ
ncbi:MAG: 1,4-alpha-glucan-branching protein [Chitinophagaceae bacterium]